MLNLLTRNLRRLIDALRTDLTTCDTRINKTYAITFKGADASSATQKLAITAVTAGATPKKDDIIVAIFQAKATSGGANTTIPAIVDKATSDGILNKLILDGESIKAQQGKGTDLSANSYYALVISA